MEILYYAWWTYLHIPLFNFLIWIYNNYTDYNFALAVIILTVIIRLVLLPFSIIEERRKFKKSHLNAQLKQISKDYSTDPIRRNEEVRKFLKAKSIRPWAKAIVLTVQGAILVILYYVFVDGINSETNAHLLYASVQKPDFINTNFFIFDIAEKSMILPAIVAGYLFAESLIQNWDRRKKKEMSVNEQLFIILFPAFSFLILAFLPSVKSVFILTSLVFSTIISMITFAVKQGMKNAKKPA
jgi:YidC/Oxa1 family membrane protein insertase